MAEKSKSLAKVDKSPKPTWTKTQKELMLRTIAKGANMDELYLFLYRARSAGLDPLAKQIYFMKFKGESGDSIAFVTGIDGYPSLSERSRQ